MVKAMRLGRISRNGCGMDDSPKENTIGLKVGGWESEGERNKEGVHTTIEMIKLTLFKCHDDDKLVYQYI